MMREKLRSELGMGAYAKVLLPTIKELSLNNDVVLDGLYSWDELVILNNEFNMTTIAVVADKKLDMIDFLRELKDLLVNLML